MLHGPKRRKKERGPPKGNNWRNLESLENIKKKPTDSADPPLVGCRSAGIIQTTGKSQLDRNLNGGNP